MSETPDDENPNDGADAVVIERTLEAPAARVWQMWTEAEHFATWYGPDGATITVTEMDVQVDGNRQVTMEMETPGGPMQMHFAGRHTVVETAKRLSYTEAMAGDHATSTEVTVTLSESGAGTTLVLTHAGIPADSPGAAGWRMALDKLAAAVAVAVADHG